MLEGLSPKIGESLKHVRPGFEKLVYASDEAAVTHHDRQLAVTSSAFTDGGMIPIVYSEDGDQISPPIRWSGVPDAAEAVAIILEDADSPTPKPLVHAIVADLPGEDGELLEGAMPPSTREDADLQMGRNSFLKRGYLPMDPPPGHGPHRYCFQVFALSEAPTTQIVGRSAFVKSLEGKVLAKGMLTATYERK